MKDGRGVSAAGICMLAAGLVQASCTGDGGRCPGSPGCPSPPSIKPTAGGPPTARIASPGFDPPRFFRAGMPIELRVETTGSIKSLDVVIDGDVAGCDMVSGQVVQHFGSPPFVGVIDTSRLDPGLHRIDVVARDWQNPPRCDSDRRNLYVDRVPDAEVGDIRIAPDSQSVAFVAGDGSAQPGLHRASRGGDRLRYLDTIEGGGSPIQFLFADRAPVLAARSGGAKAEFWIDAGREAEEIASGVGAFAIAPDASAVAYVRIEPSAYLGGAFLRRLDPDGNPAPSLLALGARHVEFADDGRAVVVYSPAGGARDSVSVFDAVTGAALASIDAVERLWWGACGHLVVQRGDGGRRLEAVWPRAAGGLKSAMLAAGDVFDSADMSADCRIFSYVVDGELHVERLATDATATPLVMPLRDVRAARLSPDGDRIVIGARDAGGGETLLLWELGGKTTHPPQMWLHGSGTFDLDAARFQPGGPGVALVDGDRLWVAPSGGAVAPPALPVDSGVLKDLAFAPDGGVLAYRSVQTEDGSAVLNLLDVAHGAGRSLITARSGISRFVWAPDGRTLATMEGLDVSCVGACLGRTVLWQKTDGSPGKLGQGGFDPPRFREDREVAASARPLAFSPDGSFLAALGAGVDCSAAAGGRCPSGADTTLILTRAR